MYLLHLSFCGTRYHGWQMQADVPTVQGTLHEALKRVLGADDLSPPTGCGRTDEGVHAVEFLAAVRAVRELATDNLRMGLNSLLPRDIRVMAVERIPGYRNARTLVAGKQYRYIICRTETLSPFLEHLVWQSRYDLPIAPMREAAAHLVGTHDFKSFQASNTEVEMTVRTIHRIEVREHGPLVVIDVIGDGFLKHMVRILSGTLVAVARGRLAPDDIPEMLTARDRSRAGTTLPGKGLYLYRLFRDTDALAKGASEPSSFSTDMLWSCR